MLAFNLMHPPTQEKSSFMFIVQSPIRQTWSVQFLRGQRPNVLWAVPARATHHTGHMKVSHRPPRSHATPFRCAPTPQLYHEPTGSQAQPLFPILCCTALSPRLGQGMEAGGKGSPETLVAVASRAGREVAGGWKPWTALEVDKLQYPEKNSQINCL